MKRLAEFFRSVLPADLTQLIFLAGIVCLFIAPHLRWWPSGIGSPPERITDSFAQIVESLGVFFLLPIKFAAVAGYYICFWPGNYPLRRILGLIFAPAIAGLCLLFSRLLYLTAPSSSVLEGTSSLAAHKISWALSLPWKLLPGFHFCLLGLLLIAIYTSRVAFGIAALPLSLPGTAASAAVDFTSWKRIQLLIWMLVGPLFLVSSLLLFFVVGIPSILSSNLPTYSQNIWFTRFSPVLWAIVEFAFILWIAGTEGRQVMRETIRIPELKYACLAMAFPIGIVVLLSTGQYLFDRAEWVTHNLGTIDPPQFGSYFTMPNPWLLLLFFSALFEEVIFRGLLQRRFIQRYGTYRGIFLVGIVWAASHFFTDFAYSRVTDQGAILKLAFRIFECVVLSYVLGWLTIRTSSILPASLTHTLFNVIVFSSFGQPLPGKNTILVGLLGALAYVLFRYWPVLGEDGIEAAPAIANSESVN